MKWKVLLVLNVAGLCESLTFGAGTKLDFEIGVDMVEKHKRSMQKLLVDRAMERLRTEKSDDHVNRHPSEMTSHDPDFAGVA